MSKWALAAMAMLSMTTLSGGPRREYVDDLLRHLRSGSRRNRYGELRRRLREGRDK